LSMSEWQIAGDTTRPTPAVSFGSAASLQFDLNPPSNTAGYWPSSFAQEEPTLSATRGFAASGAQPLATGANNIDGWLDLGAGLDVNWVSQPPEMLTPSSLSLRVGANSFGATEHV
jgi:hypothetical protein